MEQIWFKSFVATFRQLRENCNPSVHRNILKKEIFPFTDFDRCNFEHSRKTILSVLSKRPSTYPEERLDEISFLQRIRIVLPFLDFEWILSWIPAGKLCHSCRKCSCVSKLRFPAIFFVKIVQILFVLFVFWLIQLHFWLNYLRQDLQNCTLRAWLPFRVKTIRVRFFFISSIVSGFERKFCGFMAKTVRQPCQKCTFSASGTKPRKICLEKVYRFSTIFWLQGGLFRKLIGTFQKFRQNRIFCFQRNILD